MMVSSLVAIVSVTANDDVVIGHDAIDIGLEDTHDWGGGN